VAVETVGLGCWFYDIGSVPNGRDTTGGSIFRPDPFFRSKMAKNASVSGGLKALQRRFRRGRVSR